MRLPLYDSWTHLASFGHVGSDQGRDIIGTRPFDDQPDGRTVIQCGNRGTRFLLWRHRVSRLPERTAGRKQRRRKRT
ncbi:hypothetical protein FDV58_40955 [Bradyrhizobium elkanii]|uniref:Uncharacterized protein n=1 Tax=Bradyrhizobium elkanii TaxID=29448 RepID=A0A4U6RAF4_BRAEL|nr:hypothetical protein FDV58_40955 [Bradyrhizobium elkanii]